MEVFERNAFATALANTNGNIAAAAKRCNMPRRTFWGHLQRLGITVQRRLDGPQP